MAGSPASTASKWALAGDTFTKHGLVFEDHHFKDPVEGYQRSPPGKLKAMYDYLPTADALPHKQVPNKLVLSAGINALKIQSHCLGVYVLVPQRDANHQPVWKHATADLAIAATCLDDSDDSSSGWAVARFSTLGVKTHHCMRIAGTEIPIHKKSGVWTVWNGRTFSEEPEVKLRPSYHGFGAEGWGNTWNTETSVSSHTRQRSSRSASPSKRRQESE